MSRRALLVVVAWLLVVAPRAARAQDYFGDQAPPRTIEFRTDKPRTTGQRLLLAGLFGGGAVAAGVGFLFHRDARAKSDEVSAFEPTGRTYTREVDDTRRAALRSRTLARVFYGVGAAGLVAGVVAFFLTEPGTEVVTVGGAQSRRRPVRRTPPIDVALLPGGGMVGASWAF